MYVFIYVCIFVSCTYGFVVENQIQKALKPSKTMKTILSEYTIINLFYCNQITH